jgi:hypothetical protein
MSLRQKTSMPLSVEPSHSTTGAPVESNCTFASNRRSSESLDRQAAGIADPFEKHRNEPLTKHLADFRKFLINRGATSDYVATTLQRATAVIEGCGFKRIQDISAGSVVDYLAALRRSGRSIASSNHYLRAVKMFSRWLVRDRRNDDDRLTHLSRMNVELDRRRVRRPLPQHKSKHSPNPSFGWA